MEVVERFVKPGDHCVDIGAHLGIYTHLFLRLVGTTGRVTALEPQPELGQYLERAFAPEIRRGRVELHRTALGDEVGEATLSLPPEGRAFNRGRASLANHGDGSLEMTVPVRRLDDLGLEGVSFVKCDVEGFELAVFRGAATLLRERAPVLLVEIEERHAGERASQTFRFLEDLGYGAAILREADGELARIARGSTNAPELAQGWARRYVNNYFFVPPSHMNVLAGSPTLG